MIDASSGYLKDGNKNRLREMDVHQIVDVFNKRLEIAKYSRMVSVEEIEKNEFYPEHPSLYRQSTSRRYSGHRGAPEGWNTQHRRGCLAVVLGCLPAARQTLFKANRPGYLDLAVVKLAIKPTIYEYPEFVSFIDSITVSAII